MSILTPAIRTFGLDLVPIIRRLDFLLEFGCQGFQDIQWVQADQVLCQTKSLFSRLEARYQMLHTIVHSKVLPDFLPSYLLIHHLKHHPYRLHLVHKKTSFPNYFNAD